MEICGICQAEFEATADYNAHTCKTGFTPQDAEHFGPEFVAVQKAALQRGKEGLDTEGVAKQDAAIKALDGGAAPAAPKPEGSQSNGAVNLPIS